MTIEHIAIWTNQLETMKHFYSIYFNGKSNQLYHNPIKGLRTYFISFDSGSRIELMSMDNIPEAHFQKTIGLAHFAFSVGHKEKVIGLTKQLEQDGFKIVSHPRTTGDGYYESVILDPDGNQVEITC